MSDMGNNRKRGKKIQESQKLELASNVFRVVDMQWIVQGYNTSPVLDVSQVVPTASLVSKKIGYNVHGTTIHSDMEINQNKNVDNWDSIATGYISEVPKEKL